MLHTLEKALGARTLLRSAIETVAILIELDRHTEEVIAEKIDFKTFQQKVLNLMLQNRDEGTLYKATNIVTILEKCDRKYPGLMKVYAWLSESAHPNYEGMRLSYSLTDPQTRVTSFVNRTGDLYSPMQKDGSIMAMTIFDHEYQKSEQLFEQLEQWLVDHAVRLQGELDML